MLNLLVCVGLPSDVTCTDMTNLLTITIGELSQVVENKSVENYLLN